MPCPSILWALCSYRTVPTNRTGSWGMMASRERSSSSPIEAMSTPSMVMDPSNGSRMRKRHVMRVDLPDPVRPAMPIFSQELMWQVAPLRTCELQSYDRRREGECCKPTLPCVRLCPQFGANRWSGLCGGLVCGGKPSTGGHSLQLCPIIPEADQAGIEPKGC